MKYLQEILFVIVTSAAAIFGLDRQSSFMDSLSDTAIYDRRIRPYHLNSTLNINVFLTVVNFGDVGEMKSEFSLDMFFDQEWVDPRLRRQDNYDMTLLGKEKKLIWLPDTFFTNIKTAQHHNVPSDNSVVTINAQGKVLYSTRITLTASCEMDLHTYPHDSQTCMLQIMSYAYVQDEVDYHWKGDKNKAIKIINDNLAQLALNGFQIDKRSQIFGHESFTELMAIFQYKRRLGYSLLQIYSPTFLIVCLSWLSFWISKDSVPARVALVITTLLTIITLNGSFRAAVPKVSYIKAMDLYLIVSFFFVFGAILEYIAVLTHDEYKKKHAHAKGLDADMDGKATNKHRNSLIEEAMAAEQEPSDRQSNYVINRKPKRKSNRQSAREMLNEIISVNSAPIDKISKVAFPCCYLVFNIMYWIYYGLAAD